jgi:hypothetical protein
MLQNLKLFEHHVGNQKVLGAGSNSSGKVVLLMHETLGSILSTAKKTKQTTFFFWSLLDFR